MKIYTKTGDKGHTSLISGKRVLKSHFRIEAYGTIDELNSWVGLLAEYTINQPRKPFLREIQDRLFTIGSILATENEKMSAKIPDLHETDIELVESEIDKINGQLAPLT
ncbi:MAG: ATP:cob(I)alamin adenosyltransferase, partial [Cytophagales bacterium]